MALNLPLKKILTEPSIPREHSTVVYKEGSHVYAKDEKGSIICQDSPTACIKESVYYLKNLGGGRVFIKRGTYIINEEIYLDGGPQFDLKNILIEGESGTLLKRNDNVNKPVITISQAENITVKGLSIDGNKQNNNQGAAIVLWKAKNAVIKHNYIFNSITGIMANPQGGFDGPVFYMFNRLEQIGLNGSGDAMNAFGVNNVFVIGNYAEYTSGDTGFAGIGSRHVVCCNTFINGMVGVYFGTASGSSDSIMSDNVVYGGLYGAIIQNPSNRILISNNTFISNKLKLIDILNNIKIEGNVIYGSVSLEKTSNITIKGNYITNDDTETCISTKWGSGNMENIYITGNILTKCKNGIVIDTGTDPSGVDFFTKYLVISGNVITRNQLSGIVLLRTKYAFIRENYIGENCQSSDCTNPALSMWKVYNAEIINNMFFDYQDTKTQTKGIAASNIEDIKILDNIFTNQTTPISVSGTRIIIKRNSGYTTENSGVASITANSTRVTVSHGLNNAPSKVLITPLGVPPGKLWVENITNTSFDIVTDTAPATNLPVAWYAEV